MLSLWRLDALDVLQRSCEHDLGKRVNTAPPDEREDVLREVVALLRRRKDAETVAALLAIAEQEGILIPPADGGCWNLRKPVAIGDGSASIA